MYDSRTRECQLCDICEACYSSFGVVKKSVKNGYMIAILDLIADKRRVAITEVKDELVQRFGKDLNIYYYLSLLKEQGLIDVVIEGRKRFYVLR